MNLVLLSKVSICYIVLIINLFKNNLIALIVEDGN